MRNVTSKDTPEYNALVRGEHLAKILAPQPCNEQRLHQKYTTIFHEPLHLFQSSHGWLLYAPECATDTEVVARGREGRVAECVNVRRRVRAGRLQLSVRGGDSVAGEPSSAGSWRLELGRLRKYWGGYGKRDKAGGQANMTVPVSSRSLLLPIPHFPHPTRHRHFFLHIFC